MEASHVATLRKNLVYLKEHLEAGDALDHLYQEGVFTQPEYNRCKQAGPDKCGTLLELLMKKGEEAYKSLCVHLDDFQPHVKAQLDATSSTEGATSLLFVNKPKLEQEHRRAISEKEKIISDLKEEIINLKKDLHAKNEEILATKSTLEEEQKQHEVQLEEERKKNEATQEEERNKTEKVEAHLAECREEMDKLRDEDKHIKKALELEKEKYEALTGLAISKVPREEEQEKEIKDLKYEKELEECVFGTESKCDESQLMLLPCLHAACKPCIDHHTDLPDQEKLFCPCGAEVDVKVEDLSPDHVRRNEAAYNVTMKGKRNCSYTEHEDCRVASFFCQDCDECLCQECHTIHQTPKKNKDHRCTEIQKMEALPIQKWLKEMTCPDHANQALDLYDNHCKKPICVVCTHGNHQHADNKDINLVYQETKDTLEEAMKRQRCRLQNIQGLQAVLDKHQTEQDAVVDRLEGEVASIHQKMAGKFLHRQKQLLQDIRQSLEGPQQAVQEKQKTVRAAEKRVLSTMDYIQRALEYTRKNELISLTAAMENKSAEDLKVELPADDNRGTRIRLFFQGQKALEEIIDKFGSLATCISMEEIDLNTSDQHKEKNDLARELSLTCEEFQKTKTEKTLLLDELTLRDREIAEIRKVLAGAKEIYPELKDISVSLENVTPDEQGAAGQRKIISYLLVSCPVMTLSSERVYYRLAVSGEDGQFLTNMEWSSTDQRPDRFKNYNGTCSAFIPFPASPSTPTVPRYWETNTRVQVKERDPGPWYLLEMAVTEDPDGERWVSGRGRSGFGWSVLVVDCDTHQGFCTSVWEKREQVGDCLSTIPSPKRGTEVEIRLAIVLDVGRGRLAFIDVNRAKVLHKLDVTFRQPPYPVFGMSRRSDCYAINMQLVSEEEISINDCKKSLIAEAFFS